MDERLERALEFANYRITIENQKATAQRRLNTMLVFHYNNGVFSADSTTISFVAALIAAGIQTSIVLDNKNNPIEIENLKEFQDQLISTYHIALNEYATEHQKLARARNIKKAMDW